MPLPDGLSKLLNVGDALAFEGKEYKVKEATFRQRAEFATWVEQRAWQAIKRLALHDTSDADLAALRRDLLADVAAGKYEWGGPPVLAAAQTLVGSARLLWTVLKDDHPDVTEELVGRIMDAKQRELVTWLAENVDPKDLAGLAGSPAGGTASAGSPTGNRQSRRKQSATSRRAK